MKKITLKLNWENNLMPEYTLYIESLEERNADIYDEIKGSLFAMNQEILKQLMFLNERLADIINKLNTLEDKR